MAVILKATPIAPQSSRKSGLPQHGAPYYTVECLLQAFPEFRKAEMAASSVVLGLLPGMLTQLGPTAVERALLASRRPLLALLLAAASPAVSATKPGEFVAALGASVGPRQGKGSDSEEHEREHERKGARGADADLPSTGMLYLRGGSSRSANAWGWKAMGTSLCQYLIAGAAAANTGILAYQLSIWSVTSFSIAFWGLPALWVALGVIVHLGYVVNWACWIRNDRDSPEASDMAARGSGLVWSRVAAEFIPCAYQHKVVLRRSKRPRIGQVCLWAVNLGIMAHILFGTLVFSGLIFISMVDAVVIAVRFAASAIACGLVFSWEEAGIKQNTSL